MEKITDKCTLGNGMVIPCPGFGTYKVTGGDSVAVIRTAIEEGYRFFDTASLYETERFLGQAVRESGIPRSEFIIETKLWTDEMGYEGAKKALKASLERLQMDYVDLYFIHWPRQTGADDEDWKTLDIETWRAMEEMVDEGKIRALGCSNFLPHHLENLLAHCRIRPAADQLELHPGHSQEAAVAYCLEHNIRPMAWSPLGRARDNGQAANGLLEKLAKKYGKSSSQISLRFLIQKGILPIPKASSVEHMRSNRDIFDFSLTDEEVWMISCMPQTTWLGEHPDFKLPSKKSNPDQ